ncbi:hypothetical protein [Caballeronia sp. LZ032]|uniref:hypothetical protein n=1 Tax=Caballeronia sp. LZ032 TaxID=3038565 RepID=UPI0028628E62|nr:hypothetical protein [Caballeronia sp. LZ032]MDR5883596.1 hypothetical protein [Caballeronia sp. LZ032]
MRATEIFTPGRTPTVTLVREHLVERRQAFEDALEQGGMLISISGPSKSGKTVFVKSITGADNLIAITGAGITQVEQLWTRVFHQIGTPIGRTEVNESSETSTVTANGKVAGSVVVAKGEAGISGALANGTKGATTETQAIDFLQLLIAEVAGTGLVVFIDDFHYIPRDIQVEAARQIKEAIDKDVIIVCASVPYHSEDVLRANSDLRGRVVSIDFDYWKPSTLSLIAEQGFAELNAEFDNVAISLIAGEAAGSPQLMQSICLNSCFQAGIRDRPDDLFKFPNDRAFLNAACNRTAQSADYSSTLEKLNEGPKTRGTERNQYRLKDGTVGDVYAIILKAIALSPPTLHFRYPELQERIKNICEDDTPVGSSVTGACLQIAHLANDGLPKAILEWDHREDVLNIRDPYLLFFMRWSEAL